MKQISIKLQSVLIGMLYGTFCSAPVLAEDIEIYTGATGTSTEATSNILFVLDTSGSMNGEVKGPAGVYDPSVTYSSCFDPDRYYTGVNFASYNYFGTTKTGPEMYCLTYGYYYGYSRNKLDQFKVSSFKCDAANAAIATAGHYADRIAYHRNNSWRSLNGIEDDRLNYSFECKADQGVHGAASSDGKPYAANSNKWQAGASGAINWASAGSSEDVYSGNYLNYLNSPSATKTRIRTMQDALTNVVKAAEGTDINIGLMRFSSDGDGGLVVSPMGKIDDAAHKADFLLELEKMTYGGSTPLAEAYYEAVRYMQGKSVDYGNSSQVKQFTDPGNSTNTETINRKSVDGARVSAGGAYKSPISDTCQKNYIVLLTDGEPTSDDPSSKLSNIGVTGNCSAIGTSNCLEEIATSIGNNDQADLVNGKQVISTFTIGLDIASEEDLLAGTATASNTATGTGNYFAADNAVSLEAAFSNIVIQVIDTNATFASPAVSVNAFNRSTHLNDLYFTLFKPSEAQHWAGNLKKYKLEFETDPSDAAKLLPYIADNRTPPQHAIYDDPDDPNASGFFHPSALSYWTDPAVVVGGQAVGADGDNVLEGGALSVMFAGRNVYTTTGAYTLTNGVFVPGEKSLTASVNAADKTNAALTDDMLGIAGFPDKVNATPAIPYRNTLLDWAKGFDVLDHNKNGETNDAFHHMGDPLHSEPALVQYGQVINADPLPPTSDLVAYVATNDGYLHAFDVDDGTEIFSFIPQELLGSLSVALEDSGTEKLYGLDGNVVAWMDDKDGDGDIEPGEGDHVYLYVGMRRGGNNIYALDVTVRTDPKLLWVIKGGEGDYAELGETWSTVNVEKIKDGNTSKTVLIFGGGYDTQQDNVSVRTEDTVGRAVYIADATSGARLWMAGATGGDTNLSDMKYSIPARIKPLDVSGDGFVDRLYAVDMGGQIFRFDINNINGSALASSITAGRIADLAADADAVNTRRFYYPPDVALVDDPSGKYHGIVISSGYRAHPLNEETHDRIYMLKDKKTGLISTGYTTLTESDLKDVTDNLAGGNSGAKGDALADAARKAELANIAAKQGWYIDLDNEVDGSWVGEKGLAEPLIIEGAAIVTTYIPDFTQEPGTCAPSAGTGKVFYLDIVDATPAKPADTDERPERYKKLLRGGIPPTPSTLITDKKTPTACIGTECEALDFGLGVRKTYWFEVEK